MKHDSGFTIVELLIVIAILAIISNIIIPSYIRWRSTDRLKEAVSVLWGDLGTAKSQAIRKNEFVAIVFSTDSYKIFVDDGSGSGTEGNYYHEIGEEIIQYREIPAGVHIDLSKTTFLGESTRFNGRGWIGKTGKVTFYNNIGEEKFVSMENRFGRITEN